MPGIDLCSLLEKCKSKLQRISLLFKLQQHSGVDKTETILIDKVKNIYYLALYKECLLIPVLQSNFLGLNTGFITFFFFHHSYTKLVVVYIQNKIAKQLFHKSLYEA